MTFRQLIKTYQKHALTKKLETEAIRLLVLELSGYNGADFLLHINDEITPPHQKELVIALEQYVNDEMPIQHILGYSYFYGYRFVVNEDVLIPRPETEELVGYVLSYYDEMFQGSVVNVVDIGTGSGNIAITLKKEEPQMNIFGIDICPKALKVANLNALNLKAEVTFMLGDMLAPLLSSTEKFDIIVANPPYIPRDEAVEHLVLNNEPHIALFGGEDGLMFYEKILKTCGSLLKSKALLAFEHSFSKKLAMIDLAKKYFPTAQISSIKDISGRDRFLIIQREGD